jgi:hypothetical protein
MASQGSIALQAAQINLNILTGAVSFSTAGSAPTYVPGLMWLNAGVLYAWNGTAWVNYETRYLALLTADPSTSGAGGGQSVYVSDLVEVTTPGYARVPVTVGLGSSGLPCVATNPALVTWGPLTADMAVAAQWAALVTNSTGAAGILCYTWNGLSEQVDASQSIEVPANGLVLSQQ